MNDSTVENLDQRTPDIADPAHRERAAALLIVDMIGDFEHEDGEELFLNTLPAAEKLSELARRARHAKVPVIYVNDNYGEWRNDFRATLEGARNSERGRRIIELLEPGPHDYHVLKPQRSGFFSTPLDVLLTSLKVSTLIITGIATDICVLFTANDAYMRGYRVMVPSDCTAAVTADQASETLALLERVADADTSPSADLDLCGLVKGSRSGDDGDGSSSKGR